MSFFFSKKTAALSHHQNRIKRVSFFAALCLFLSTIEYAIPKPLPFMRLGIANIPIILSLYVFPSRDIFLLTFIKVIGQGLLSGTVFSYVFLFSASGTFSSMLIMLFLFTLFSERNLISPCGLSIAGSLANNITQLSLSWFLIFGQNTRYFAPLLLISGLISGTSIGILTEYCKNNSHWFKQVIREL